MVQTFNRRPYLQDGPRKSDIENHTFDNYKFTGFKEDKNFLEIDQYSFEECNNIYVDNDGLLRSRPSIKNANLFEGAINIFRQNDVYIAQYNGYYNIYYGDYSQSVNGTVYAATSYGDKVYIFAEGLDSNEIVCYDKKTPSATVQTENLIYVPETEVQANSDTTKAEPKNALTEKTKKIYLYTSSQFASDLYGKTITYEAFGETFEFVFNNESKKTILRTLSNVNRYSNWSQRFANGTFFVYKYVYTEDVFNYINIAYSVDGINFIELSPITINISGIQIFDDGTGFFAYNGSSLYKYIFSEQTLTSYFTLSNGYFTGVNFAGTSDYNIAICAITSGAGSSTLYKYIYNGGTPHDIVWTDGQQQEHPAFGPVKLYRGNVTLYGSINSYIYYIVEASPDIYCVYYQTTAPANSLFYFDISDPIYAGYRDIVLNKLNYSIICKNNARISLIIVDLLRGIGTLYSFESESGTSIKLNSDGESYAINGGYQKINDIKYPWKITNGTLTSILGFYNNNVYGTKIINNELYLVTSYFDSSRPIKLTEIISGDDTIIAPEQIEQLNEYYFRVGNKLYISEYREDDEGNLQWYLPEINIEEFDGFVTMCPLSSTEMGIFTETGVYVVYRSEQQYEMSTGWKYYPYIQIKSKMDVKIRKGSDVLSTYDGTSLIVPTTRGLALMTYQDFVQSTDQKLEFLSDTIYDAFDKYNTSGIKLFRYSYWFFVYRLSDNMLFLLDIRNGSWWPMSGNKSLKSFILYNDKPLLLTNDEETYVFDKSADNYKDDDGFIDWYLRSQKLYLGAANYYKHIQNLTFMSHLLGDNDDGYTFKCYLRNTAYRSRVSSDAEGKMWEYNIEMIRSYVLRLNYPKVCEFQYELRMNKENTTVDFTPVPLSLSNITVKYRMGGQIR